MRAALASLFILPFSSAVCLAQTHAGLDAFSWLAGCWQGEYANGRTVTEQWMKPLGNSMLGMGRTVKGGVTTEHEFVRIEARPDGSVVYVANPSGQEEATFTLSASSGQRMVFENLQHDFPQRVIYERVSRDSLRARIEGTVDGRTKGVDFPYRRISCE
jgi:hypothetical protein